MIRALLRGFHQVIPLELIVPLLAVEVAILSFPLLGSSRLHPVPKGIVTHLNATELL